ncbi:MAG: BtpA/SgcQ family protein [bacterium]
MRSFEDTFGGGKILLGVIHLRALPGSPAHRGGLAGVVTGAVEEARMMAGAGFGGLIIENYGDIPFLTGRVAAETVAAMAVVAAEVKKAVKIPTGINVLRNDAESALAIAGACGCEFIRVNVLVGAFVTSEGLVEGRPGRVARRREAIAPDALILADIMVKHARPLGPTTLGEDALDAVERGRADAVIVTGPRTGRPPAMDDLETVRASLKGAGLGVPILVGSGAEPSNAEDFLRLADGLIVGSYIRRGGMAGERLDGDRTREMGNLARRVAPMGAPRRAQRKRARRG